MVDFILQLASVTEQPVTLEELMADPDDDGQRGGGERGGAAVTEA